MLIPSFAVGRAQLVLHYIRQLKLKGAIPEIPVFLNSPMANKANGVFYRNSQESKMSEREAQAICETARPICTVEESIALVADKAPKIIISASGMATGGRVLHHLKSICSDPKHTILFVGYQAGGTRGATIASGGSEVKIHGEYYPIRAEVSMLESLSAHADAKGVLNWVQNLAAPPRRIYITHGEPAQADALRVRFEDALDVEVHVPEFRETIEI